MDTLSVVLILAACAVLLYVLIKILSAPVRLITKLLLNAAVGYVVLFIFDFFAEFYAISVELNLVNALVVGFLGIPGILLLVLLKFL